MTTTTPPPFTKFPKIPRLDRDIIVTEKLDGTNATVHVTEDGQNLFAASRNRWIIPEDDNFGFARWVSEHKSELLGLGPGIHRGEWWGSGIQRRYDLDHKRFSLFNTYRWSDDSTRPTCCHVVPVLYQGPFSLSAISSCLSRLHNVGSIAAPGFNRPEGVVIFHVASNRLFKKTLDGDGHKGAQR